MYTTVLPHQMIRIKRSEPISQLSSTDIGLVYFKCKGQEGGMTKCNVRWYVECLLSGILCLDIVFLSNFGPGFRVRIFFSPLDDSTEKLVIRTTRLFSRRECVLLQHMFCYDSYEMDSILGLKKFMVKLELECSKYLIITLSLNLQRTMHMSAL